MYMRVHMHTHTHTHTHVHVHTHTHHTHTHTTHTPHHTPWQDNSKLEQYRMLCLRLRHSVISQDRHLLLFSVCSDWWFSAPPPHTHPNTPTLFHSYLAGAFFPSQFKCIEPILLQNAFWEFIIYLNTCHEPHLETSPKCFGMATTALFWDLLVLHATVVKQGWNGYQNKCEHR